MINKLLFYLRSLEGVKYTFWNPESGKPKKDEAPFWIANKAPPKIEMIKKDGICCAGIANIARRYMNLQVPGHINGEINKINFIGGTENWFTYLKNNNKLSDINYNDKLPEGTLLLQNYNDEDQGHVAVIIQSSDKGLMDSEKIHAVSHLEYERYNKVVIEKFKDYPYYKRYTHFCLPEDWLIK